jgi:hypothetical protein
VGSVAGYLDRGLPLLVYELPLTSTMALVRMIRAGSDLAPRPKALISNGGSTHPMIAPADGGVMVSWWTSGTIYSKQVCAP